jgi:putative membrane protein
MRPIVYIIINTLAALAAAYILPGIAIRDWITAIVVAVVLGVLNAVVKPVLIFLTLPATVLTLGLFLLVINAAIVLIAAWLVPGFKVDGFWWALAFSVTVSLINSVLLAIA